MRQIHIETTPNPKVLKFVTEHQLIPGAVELDRSDDLTEIPMAEAIFNFPFIQKIYITSNFIALAKEDTVEWEDVQESLKNTIEDELLANPAVYRRTIKKVFPVYAEMTPNPDVMKFVSDKQILDGFLEFKDKNNTDDAPVAKALFEEFPFVREVFINENFIAVTKDDSCQWHEVMTPVRSFIAEYLQDGKPVANIPGNRHESPVEKIINRAYTDEEEKINAILEEYVAPAVEGDGGKISLLEYLPETKTAKMLLQGACSGCPSSTATLKNGIENLLKQFLPDLVENVEAVNG